MTVEEIFSNLSVHMVRGLMTHSDFADYYYFLGLEKYGDEHHNRYVDESLNHRKLQKWYILHYNKLLPQERVDYKTFIPDSWYKYKRFDVDSGTISKSVKNGLTMWVDWERETKKLYEQMYKELMSLDEITAALFVKDLICDVRDELCEAEEWLLKQKALDYSIENIIAEQ